MKMLAKFAIALVVTSTPAFGATFHTDDFESGDSQEWGGGGGAGTVVSHVATGGPAGAGDGFLQIDAPGGFLASFNQRTDWTGSFAALAPVDKLLVNVDLMSPAESDPLSIRLVMFEPSATRWTSAMAQAVPSDGVWRNYTFSLAATALVRVAGAGDYAALMAGVERVMFRHDPDGPSAGGEYVSGTLNLDNIELAKDVLPGDFDENFVVDGTDLARWETNFGLTGTATHTDGDADGDEDVDGADFLVWQGQLGDVPVVATAASVPEPKALVLLLLFGLRRSRRLSLAGARAASRSSSTLYP